MSGADLVVGMDDFWRGREHAIAEYVARDPTAAPVRVDVVGRLRRREVLVIPRAERERVGRTLVRIGRCLPTYTLGGDDGERVTDLELAERGVEPGRAYVVEHARPEPSGISIDAAWDRIEAWLDEHGGEDVQLNAGATDAAIAAAERRIGMAFPDPLRAFLGRHDGQDGADPVVEGHLLLAAEHIAGDYATARSIVDDQGPSDGWFQPEWIPFTYDGSGNSFCLDTRTGAVFSFVHDGDSEQVAGSLEGWVARWAVELETGEQVPSGDGGVDLVYLTL